MGSRCVLDILGWAPSHPEDLRGEKDEIEFAGGCVEFGVTRSWALKI